MIRNCSKTGGDNRLVECCLRCFLLESILSVERELKVQQVRAYCGDPGDNCALPLYSIGFDFLSLLLDALRYRLETLLLLLATLTAQH